MDEHAPLKPEDENPLVSVVILTFNQAPYLREAIESATAQTYANKEILVVDNGSSDGTAEIVAEYPTVRRIYLENRGPSSGRNRGIAEAKGEYIAFLDGDDRMRADCIEGRLRLAQTEPNFGLIAGSYRIVDREGNEMHVDHIAPPDRDRTTFWEAVHEMRCPTCGLLVGTKAARDVGGFDESLRIAEDSKFLIAIARKYTCLVDHEPRADYRQVPGSISRNYLLWFDSYRRMIKSNAALTDEKAKYFWRSQWAFYNLCRLQVFSKILRDRTVSNRLGTLFGLMVRRPLLFLYAPAYAFSVIWRKLARRRGPGHV